MHANLALYAVSTAFAVPVEAITGPSRKKEVCDARHAFAWIMRRHSRMPLRMIGDRIGRNHGTVLHSVGLVEALRATDRFYARSLNHALSLCTPQNP